MAMYGQTCHLYRLLRVEPEFAINCTLNAIFIFHLPALSEKITVYTENVYLAIMTLLWILLFAFCYNGQTFQIEPISPLNGIIRIKRNENSVETNEEIKKLTTEIEETIQYINKYSKKVGEDIKKINAHRNGQNEEIMDAVVRQKQLVDKREELIKEVAELDQQMDLASEKILLLIRQTAEQEMLKAAVEEKWNKLNAKLQAWMKCMARWSCLNIANPGYEQIINALSTLDVLDESLSNTRNKTEGEKEKYHEIILKIHHSMLEMDSAIKEERRCAQELLNNARLTEKVSAFQLHLGSLKVNVDFLKREMEQWQKLNQEFRSLGLATVHEPLETISKYLNDGGFVKDLFEWGIDIRNGSEVFTCKDTEKFDKVLCKLKEESSSLFETLHELESFGLTWNK